MGNILVTSVLRRLYGSGVRSPVFAASSSMIRITVGTSRCR
jgi:hypothetical protein